MVLGDEPCKVEEDARLVDDEPYVVHPIFVRAIQENE